MPFEEDL